MDFNEKFKRLIVKNQRESLIAQDILIGLCGLISIGVILWIAYYIW